MLFKKPNLLTFIDSLYDKSFGGVKKQQYLQMSTYTFYTLNIAETLRYMTFRLSSISTILQFVLLTISPSILLPSGCLQSIICV